MNLQRTPKPKRKEKEKRKTSAHSRLCWVNLINMLVVIGGVAPDSSVTTSNPYGTIYEHVVIHWKHNIELQE